MSLCRTLVTCLFAVPLALGVTGCDKIAEKIREKAVEKTIEAKSGGQVQVDLGGKKFSAISKSGKQVTGVGAGATLPADFPKQVPIYPGATLTISHADNSGPPKYGLFFNVADSREKVVAFYKEQLKSFKLEQEMASEGGHVLLFTDKEQSKLRVQMAVGKGGEDETQTGVMLNVETLR